MTGAFLCVYCTFVYPLNPLVLLQESTLQIYTHMCKIIHSNLFAALLFEVTRDWKQPEFPGGGLIE